MTTDEIMEKPESILQQDWLDSSEGIEVLVSILQRHRRRIFGKGLN